MDNDLYDLKYVGDKYTWSNKNGDKNYTKERLDKVIAKKLWKHLFLDVSVETLPTIGLDHKPIILWAFKYERRVVSKLFRFEANWTTECGKLIEHEWGKWMDLG